MNHYMFLSYEGGYCTQRHLPFLFDEVFLHFAMKPGRAITNYIVSYEFDLRFIYVLWLFMFTNVGLGPLNAGDLQMQTNFIP